MLLNNEHKCLNHLCAAKMDTLEQSAIEQTQNGELEEFTILYDLYVKRIYDFIYYRTSHKQTAEDLTSITFTKAFQNIKTFRMKDGLFSAWLFRIARNTLIDHMRTRKSTVDLEYAFNVKADQNVEREVEQKIKLDEVKNYLTKLSPEQREIVVMRLWDDLSYSEIATLTGKTEGNCKVIFSRMMQKMQKELLPLVILLLLFLFN